jgi:hypothetical protein
MVHNVTMPLILAAGAPTASGLSYADVPGTRHEFPVRYRKLMIPGTPFIYYRGTRARQLGLSGPAYFGSGVVGTIEELPNQRLRADILDYVAFPFAIHFRKEDGDYLEPLAATRPVFWREGIRQIDEESFEQILKIAASSIESVSNREIQSPAKYASSQDEINQVDMYAISAAKSILGDRFGTNAISEMPHNNPGFDISVRMVGEPDLHVEVKGTRSPSPVFFLTEGERIHSQEYAEGFKLLIVYAIDLSSQTHDILEFDGEIGDTRFQLVPRQWQVRPH